MLHRNRPAWWRTVAMLGLIAGVAAAAVSGNSGNFKYTDNGTTITIDGYVTDVPGPLVIPSTMPGLAEPLVEKPVTAIKVQAFFNSAADSITIPEGVLTIGDSAFNSCAGATSVTLPASLQSIGSYAFNLCSSLASVLIPPSVTVIGGNAFSSCIGLVEINVDASNPNFSSIDGVLFDNAGTTLIQYPHGRSGGYAIPDGVLTIGANAFIGCSNLTGVTVPSSLTGIGNLAFYQCNSLAHLSFVGNAPTLGSGALAYAGISVPSGLKVYHFTGKTGFGDSSWSGYTQVVMGAPTPTTDWLLSLGLPYDTDVQSDANGDGVNLLMAYALNLNPSQNLSGRVPQAVFGASQMSMSFYAGTPGVTYVVEACTNFADWSTTGVTLSAPDGNQIVTATVDMTGPSRYMRLKVSD